MILAYLRSGLVLVAELETTAVIVVTVNREVAFTHYGLQRRLDGGGFVWAIICDGVVGVVSSIGSVSVIAGACVVMMLSVFNALHKSVRLYTIAGSA